MKDNLPEKHDYEALMASLKNTASNMEAVLAENRKLAATVSALRGHHSELLSITMDYLRNLNAFMRKSGAAPVKQATQQSRDPQPKKE